MNWQLRADRSWSSSRTRQWVTACIVSRKGIRVTTESEDTMTQLRGAWRMLEFIRQYYPAKARELRKKYGYSRFYDLYKEWQRFELAPDICIEHLESDLSNVAMVMQVQDVHDPRPEWMRGAQMIYNKVNKFVEVSYDGEQWFTDWAKSTRELFREKGIK
jgi:hypothetical protein